MMQGQHQLQNADRWYEAKTSAKHPTTEHVVDAYIVTVGFEVNKPAAFTCQTASIIDRAVGSEKEYCIQNLDIDYGHAFFYVTKNHKVTAFFSFGPDGGNKYHKAHASRPSNSDYYITESTKLFRLLITKGSYDLILQEISRIREKVKNIDQKYTAWLNDTCAEEARDILKKGITNIPKGTGGVSKFGVHVVDAVNPYMWYRNFKKAGYTEYSFPLWKRYLREDGTWGWTLKLGSDSDPLVKSGIVK